MEKKRSATLKEVAEKAGVSLMTVSRVLNHRNLVKQATIDKIEKAIDELNYRPNVLARGLAGGNSMVIGVVYHNPSSGYLSEILVGAMTACRDMGHQLVLEDLSNTEGEVDPAIVTKRLQKMGLDGLLLTPPLSSNVALVKSLKQAAIPTILVGRQNPQQNFSCVSFDDTAAAFAMTEFLIKQGHHNIGFIAGSKDLPFSERRKDGFLRAMERNGVTVQEQFIEQGDYTFKSGMDAGGRLLDGAARPTAIFASNDDMAAGVIAAAHSRCVAIPSQISIVGFDDTEVASAIWPSLTTVRQPISEIARSAVQILSDGNQNSGVATIIDTISIVERNSVARNT